MSGSSACRSSSLRFFLFFSPFWTGIVLAQVAAPLDTSRTTLDRPAQPAGKELICRGGPRAFAISGAAEEVAGQPRMQLNFSHSSSAPGGDRQAMQPGTCSWSDARMGPGDLHQVVFVASTRAPAVAGRAAAGMPAAGDADIAAHLESPGNFWRFNVSGQQYGWYTSSDHGPWQPAIASGATTSAAERGPAEHRGAKQLNLPENFFRMDANATVDVDGTAVRVGDIRAQLQPAIDSMVASPVSTVVDRATAAEGRPAAANIAGAGAPSAVQQLTNPAASALTGTGAIAAGKELEFAGGQKLNCDGEAPTLTQVKGKVLPGAQFTLFGFCLGDRTGRVQALGQVPGGKLELDVVAWRHDLVVVTMPELSGITDQHLALTITRADGKQSAPKQTAMRVESRLVELPANYISPAPKFQLLDSWQKKKTDVAEFRVSMNSACSLDSIHADVTTGSIYAIWFYHGDPPHNSRFGIDSWPQCTDTKYTKDSPGIISPDVYTVTVCKTLYDLKAYAYCPLGVKP